MKKWRTMIVEDDESSSRHLAKLLSAHPEVTVVAAASDLPEAEELFLKTRPDLLLLDIEMPGGTGFDLLPKLDPVPKIIFITAHSDFALHAFEINAVDYILKPVFADRLANALSRVLGHGPTAGTTFTDSGAIFLRTDHGSIMVPTRDVLYITAEGNFSYVSFLGNGRQMVYRTLSQWEQRLPDHLFKRIDRSLIVNLSRIGKITKLDRNRSQIQFHGKDRPLQIGRPALQRLNQEIRTL